ncbi:hypothetical protein SS1G_08801 [Sclerotinia sclerotiorum 1980 UF-70]|uniref:Uncharacterized protein n=1 Tax=Sclerotinia sclerotiorum (strain ATCC 18683 / 1980 / Ss-1) TaxID=665079 RepID=A7ETZ4_SCLS1|nr:hypothetical protein SS1G_08801 [Sclerotinia sclerotiorum 1980 UF-70]EDN92936.1 hypothetical protein SS1G_08801 [Sclerotinia sclerotiorum 1980 UF-70]
MAEQDTLASHFGGHPIPTEKVTERVSRWTFVSLGKAATDDTSNTTVYEQDRFASNASIIPPWNPQVNATAVGLLQRSFLPTLTTNTTLSLISYTIARLTNRLDLKDIIWPLSPLISSWTVALQRSDFDISQTCTNMTYSQKLIMAGLTTWSLRLFYRITSRALSRGGDAQTEKYQEERYEKMGEEEKLGDFRGLKGEKNSFWPGVQEWDNGWLWGVLGVGVVGVHPYPFFGFTWSVGTYFVSGKMVLILHLMFDSLL